MNKEFVTYEHALALKELGFDEHCFGYFIVFNKQLDTISSEVCEKLCKHDTHIKAPLYQQAFRWFREKYDLRIWIESNRGVLFYEYIIATTNPSFINRQFTNNEVFNTYEEAEQACLDKLIEIVRNTKS